MKFEGGKITYVKYGEEYVLKLTESKVNQEYTTTLDIASLIGGTKEEVVSLIEENGGAIKTIEVREFDLNDRDKKTNVDILVFKEEDNCMKSIKDLEFEEKINTLYERVKGLEKKYSSKQNRTKEYIKNLYSEKYILDIWDVKKVNKNLGKEFKTFDTFLLNYIEQEIIFE